MNKDYLCLSIVKEKTNFNLNIKMWEYLVCSLSMYNMTSIYSLEKAVSDTCTLWNTFGAKKIKCMC